MIRRLVCGLIWLYQRTISPDHGPLSSLFPRGVCRFRPTCSEYARICFSKFGFFKALFRTISRVCRCHPWAEGGEDWP